MTTKINGGRKPCEHPVGLSNRRPKEKNTLQLVGFCWDGFWERVGRGGIQPRCAGLTGGKFSILHHTTVSPAKRVYKLINQHFLGVSNTVILWRKLGFREMNVKNKYKWVRDVQRMR
jgi:hypothetical protein